MHNKEEGQKNKHINPIAVGIPVAVVFVVVVGIVYHCKHTFRISKWLDIPEERTAIVDDLLEKYELIGMTESDVVALLGEPNNDYGYFNADNRYVYYMGLERGLISIDSEWLILDFTDGIVSDAYIKTD